MTIRRTNRGVSIDMEALISASNAQTPAVGNMGVNANGDKLGSGGVVVKKNEERVRDYYQKNPKSSTANTSLKGEAPSKAKMTPDQELQPDAELAPKTAKTTKENKRTKKKKAEPAPATDPELTVDEPHYKQGSFDEPQPLGYNEKELPNGDFEFTPYFKPEDAE